MSNVQWNACDESVANLATKINLAIAEECQQGMVADWHVVIDYAIREYLRESRFVAVIKWKD